jgi:tetratricopeptide (TPR) repeat protein
MTVLPAKGRLLKDLWASAAIVVLAIVALAPSVRAEPLVRYGDDAREVEWLEHTYPGVTAKLVEGEDVLRRASTPADFEKALALFKEADKLGPGSAILPRRQCQALIELGRRMDAIDACAKALGIHQRSAATLRAAVAARLAGSGPPGVQNLGFALQYEERTEKLVDGRTLRIAGRCDIAAKLGDVEMLNRCIEELEKLDPNDYETMRAKALAATVRPGFGTLSVWLGLLALVVGTVCHAIMRRRRPVAAGAAVAVLFFVALRTQPCAAEEAASSGHVAGKSSNQASNAAESSDEDGRPGAIHGGAGHMSKYPINEANPESSVPTPAQRDADPIQYGYFIMDLGDQAEWAIKKGDHLKAGHMYAALAKAVPDEANGFTRACRQYELAGDLQDATKMCGDALTANHSVLADYSHYARLALQQKKLAPTDLQNLDAVVAHLKSTEETRLVGLDIECAVGAHEADSKRLQRCVPDLVAKAPDNYKTLYYAWALAMSTHDYSGAERLVDRMKKSSAAPSGDDMKIIEKATLEAMPAWRKGLHAFSDWRVGALSSVVVFSGLALMLIRRRADVPSTS